MRHIQVLLAGKSTSTQEWSREIETFWVRRTQDLGYNEIEVNHKNCGSSPIQCVFLAIHTHELNTLEYI